MMKMMRKILTILIFLLLLLQENKSQETYGRTLNLGIGLGYYGYLGGSTPVLHANYELDVAKNFTLAPFISFYSYNSNSYWTGENYYSVVVVPIGILGNFYFDQLFMINEKWDIYGGASLGFNIRSERWDTDYRGERVLRNKADPVYLDIHVGAEYHINNRIGIFLDLSSGVSTFGVALHMN
jgi:hypothetical protein